MERTPTHKNFFKKKASNKYLQRGQGMTEYIIIVGVIAIAAIGAFGYFGDTVENQLAGMSKKLAGEDATAARTAAKTAATKAAVQGTKANTLGNFDDSTN